LIIKEYQFKQTNEPTIVKKQKNRIRSFRNKVSILFLLFFLVNSSSYSAEPVIITDKDIDELHFWKGENIEILEDLDNTIELKDILSGIYDKQFIAGTKLPVTRNNNVTYWAKLKIKKLTNDNNLWVLEAYDQSIDEIEFYVPDENGKYVRYEGGDNKPFLIRQYKHKNFVFNIPLKYNQELVVYLKMKSSHNTFFKGVVRNVRSFIGYALKEYFFLALFYGLVISMIIFNLMQYFLTKSRIYLIYVAYIFSAAMFSASQDGLGHQFIWTAFPEINNLSHQIASFFVITLSLILAYEFLKDTELKKIYIQIGVAFIAIRLLYFILSILEIPLFPYFIIDIVIRIFILALSIQALYNGHRQLRYFTVAMSTLVIGYTIRELTINGILPHSITTVYMHLFGESLQMLFISLALGERIKIKMEDLVESQEKSLLELEQTHIKTEKLRKNLQQRVEEQITREKYVSGGISELSNIIANYLNDTDQLYKKISKFLAEYFECRLTALYLIYPGDNYLELTSGYGLDEIRLNGVKIHEGEGLLGQCLIDKERIEIREVPEEYIAISSGLGQATPKLIILEPLHFNQQLVGVIEMASFKELTPLQYEVLDKFTSQIASTLSNVMFNETTRKMLDESINKEEMLRQQEEEMRQQVEELMATQEEFTRKEKEYLALIDALKSRKRDH
jgi:hypothetical protein